MSVGFSSFISSTTATLAKGLPIITLEGFIPLNTPAFAGRTTIREDLRVMRSDILGFNAPIVQSGGHYSYEDRYYSIFNVSIQDGDLLKRILEFILEIRSEVKRPDMDKIIERISEALPEIRSAKETGPEYDDLKSLSSFMRAGSTTRFIWCWGVSGNR